VKVFTTVQARLCVVASPWCEAGDWILRIEAISQRRKGDGRAGAGKWRSAPAGSPAHRRSGPWKDGARGCGEL